MIDISAENAGKFFGDDQILKDITFSIYEGQKVGLIGKNGSGKTTLFKLVSGTLRCDEGSVSTPSIKRVGVLDQIPQYPEGTTVRAVLESAFSDLHTIKRELDDVTTAISHEPHNRILSAKLGQLQSRYEDGGGYRIETEISKVSNGLGIIGDMQHRPFSVLSGGEQTRINLARMILMRTDILLLDEPTNHLDLKSIEWLEQYLRTYRGTILIISHDRYFLDNTVSRIIEIENMHAMVYEGNYTAFAAEKEAMLTRMQTMYEQEQREMKRLTQTARQMRMHGTEKLIRRAKSIEKRIERMQKTEKIYTERNINASFNSADRSGYEVLNIKELSKTYEKKKVLDNITLGLRKDESVALIGENGTGKTTLLKILIGQELQDSGRFEWGSNVKKAYLPQQVEFDNEHRTVLRTIMDELGLPESAARNRLGSYHFHGDDVFLTIDVLSGGERSRLRLCIVMFFEVNTLILDEPTNHLDIASREWIEETLDNYEGTMLFVSHDRYFIDRFATRIWPLSDGRINDFKGTYARYLERLSRPAAAVPAQTPESPRLREKKPEREKRESNKRLVIIERDIGYLEDRLREIADQMETSATEHKRLSELYEERATVQKEIDELFDEWERLTD
jgi:ATP-binding cassette, subfamily F, member 3